MQIGNKFSRNKIYRGIRHYDSLPLLSEDIHEYADTVYTKNALIMNNILGAGFLNSPEVTFTDEGISIDTLILLLNGDISIVETDYFEDDYDSYYSPLINKEDIVKSGLNSGVVCIVGWYQEIFADSVLRNYGGVRNSIIDTQFLEDGSPLNDLADNKFGVQVTSRYQFRWLPTIVPSEILSWDAFSAHIEARDKDGYSLDGNSTLSFNRRFNSESEVWVGWADSGVGMDYAVDNQVYLIPVIDYSYDPSTGKITKASPRMPITTKGSSSIIRSDTEPTGKYPDGTTWYNPITREFKTYIEGDGFVDSTSTMGFLQYQSVHVVSRGHGSPTNIPVDINISELQEGDILQVVYEGLTLILGEHYTVDYENQQITLLGFTTEAGDRISFTVTKIVEANDITNITSTFLEHMSATGSSSKEAHVKLSDSVDSTMDSSKGVAATPKSVYESKLLSDESGNKYKFGVENGLLYLEEV